jgi:hypothetical protein
MLTFSSLTHLPLTPRVRKRHSHLNSNKTVAKTVTITLIAPISINGHQHVFVSYISLPSYHH